MHRRLLSKWRCIPGDTPPPSTVDVSFDSGGTTAMELTDLRSKDGKKITKCADGKCKSDAAGTSTRSVVLHLRHQFCHGFSGLWHGFLSNTTVCGRRQDDFDPGRHGGLPIRTGGRGVIGTCPIVATSLL